LQDLFNRRLKQGRCFQTPCLGWSELTCSYWGPFRTGVTEVDEALELEVPSMLLGVWDDPTQGRYAPTFRQAVKVVHGRLHYDLASTTIAQGDRPEMPHAQ
jgi:CRISPR-associated protein Cas5d